MANYFIAGRADDVGFATVERIGDCMQALLPAAVLTKFMLSPEDWEDFRENHIRNLLGSTAPKTSPIVWDVSGRLIGGTEEFKELARTRYGISVDVTEEELERIAEANAEAARCEKRRKAIRHAVKGRRALVIVDVQNDFCEGGALAVPEGNDVIPVINSVRKGNDWDLVVLTQDWHPPSHSSFASNNEDAKEFEKRELPDVGLQVMWPDHCVEDSIGADFHPYLARHGSDVVVRMGTNPKADSYSAFGDAFGGKYERTELADVLRKAAIEHVFVVGLAYDFAVSFTAKDAVSEGFDVYVVEDGTRGIADASIESETAEMKGKGVKIVQSGDLPKFSRSAEGEREFKRVETGTSAFIDANKRALIVVDVQNDFCEGGPLEVPEGSAVVPVINRLREECKWDLVVFTQDYHPADHVSFASNNPGTTVFSKVDLPGIGEQTMWPDHCIQESLGANFHSDLKIDSADIVVRKGCNPKVDSYSGFGDSTGGTLEKTELLNVLDEHGIRHVFVVGLATDYCVSFTAKDAAKAGFRTIVVTDACRGLAKETVASEMDAWRKAGIMTCLASEVPAAGAGSR